MNLAPAPGAVALDRRPGRMAGPVSTNVVERRRAPALTTIASYLVIAVVALAGFKLLLPAAFGGPAGYVMVRGVSMLPTYKGGDLVITHPSSSYGKGDIIAYTVPKGEFGAGILVIHRIIGGSAENGFVIQGDNNGFADPWHPKPKDIIGKTWVHIPRLGLLLAFLHAPVPLASLAAGVVVAMIAVPPKKQPQKLPANVIALRPRLERSVTRLNRVHVGLALVVAVSAVLLLAGGTTFASDKHRPVAPKQNGSASVLARRACLAYERAGRASSDAGANAAMVEALRDSNLAAAKDNAWIPLARSVRTSTGAESDAVNVTAQCAAATR